MKWKMERLLGGLKSSPSFQIRKTFTYDDTILIFYHVTKKQVVGWNKCPLASVGRRLFSWAHKNDAERMWERAACKDLWRRQCNGGGAPCLSGSGVLLSCISPLKPPVAMPISCKGDGTRFVDPEVFCRDGKEKAVLNHDVSDECTSAFCTERWWVY
jgi:hypothetical protein